MSSLRAISGVYTDSYFSISFRNSDGTWCSNDPNGDNPGWGIKNNSDGVGRLPDNLYFVIDPNIIYKQTTLGEKGWAGIHETTKLEILNEYNTVNSGNVQYEYWLMDDQNNRVAKFEPVRNQNQGLHTMSTSSYAATVWYDQIFPSTSTATTFNFYVKAWKKTTSGQQTTQVQYDELPNDLFNREDYEYRPWDNAANMDPDPNGATKSTDEKFNNNNSPYFHSYGDCVVRVSKGSNSSNSYNFQLSKDYKGTDSKSPASYTILLNTGNYYDSDNDSRYGNESIDKDGNLLTNKATNNDHLPVRGIGVHPNKVLPTTPSSDKPMYIVSNMQQTNKDYYHNAEVDPDNHTWTVDKSYPMQQVTSDQLTNLIKQYPLLAEANSDNVWTATITKPGTESAMKSIFMAFASSDDREALEKVANSTTATNDEKAAAWNKVIRPFVAEGKDAISLFGGLYRPVNLQNGNQALSPGTDDMFYSQCQVYVNLTRSTYYVVPITGYDLTGPAIQYLNKVHDNDKTTWKWEGSGSNEAYWGNGETAYWATPMSYNKTLNCWEYTGKFFTSKCFAENDNDKTAFNVDKAESENKQWDNYTDASGSNITQNGYMGFYGFRFLTNHLYTLNYREDYDRPTSTTHHSDLTAYWDGNSTVKTGHEDTYYYNHVDLDPNPDLTVSDYASAAVIKGSTNGNDEKIHNINFSLPDGTYTIRFYPNGDGKDNHPFYKISDALPNVPDVPRDDDNLRDYHFLRTFSSTTMRKLGENQQCFIVTAYDQSSRTATLTSLPYVPANTGVIIAAKTSSKDDLISTGKAKQLVDDIYEALNGYLTLDYVTPADSIKLEQDNPGVKDLLKKNLLMPTTYYDENAKTTIEGGQVVKACTFEDGSTDFTTAKADKVAYRNFNFSFYKKTKDQAKYTLGFYRIRNAEDANAKTTAHHAWLRLPADISGGSKAQASLDYNISSNYDTSKAKIFNSFVVDFPDWNNTTAIENVDVEPTIVSTKASDNYVYDLMGRRVAKISGRHSAKLPKGIYIAKGKKFVVR